MSWWEYPTTADVGLCAFATSEERIIEEMTRGMQEIIISESASNTVGELTRKTGVWSVVRRDSLDNTLVAWLEEVLYQCEVEGRWLVDLHVMLSETEVSAQVSYVNEEEVVREVEIKAVTRHSLMFQELLPDESFAGHPPDVPVMEGPGWVGRVVFDI